MAKHKKRADRRYEYKITLGKHLDGRYIRKSFYSRISYTDAKKQALDYKAALERAPFVEQTEDKTLSVPFSDWARTYIEKYKKGTVRESTYKTGYRQPVELHLIPFFGDKLLNTIRQFDIQEYINQSPLNSKTQSSHLALLFRIFESAIDNGYCDKNPVKNISVKRTDTSKEKRVYTLEQVQTLESYCFSRAWYDMIILLETGIRRAELLGLQWGDVDTQRKLLSVRRAVSRQGDKQVVGETKTKTSIRDIPLSETALKAFSCAEHRGKFIFGTDDPPHLDAFEYSFRSRMEEASRALNIPALTPHELRHTFGTVLREKGADLYTIQHALGHANIKMTASVYVHNDTEVLRRDMHLDE